MQYCNALSLKVTFPNTANHSLKVKKKHGYYTFTIINPWFIFIREVAYMFKCMMI